MKRLGIIVNSGKARAAEVLHAVAAMATNAGMKIVIDDRAQALAPELPSISTANFGGVVDAVVVLGGDGTMLEAAHRIKGSDLPLIGLNLGSLGYLTSVEESQFGMALDCLKNEQFRVEKLTTLDCKIIRAGNASENLEDALNDVVIGRSTGGRLIWLKLEIDGRVLTTYACDGIIICTPTGSTAYNLAAGGPIIMPGTSAFAIGVICPHTLTSRPLVISDNSVVTISMARADADTSSVVSIDGQDGTPLNMGDFVRIQRSSNSVSVIHLPGYNAFNVLSRKLGWGGVKEENYRNSDATR